MKKSFSDKFKKILEILSMDLRTFILTVLACVFLIAGCIVSLFFLLHSSLKAEAFTYELGTRVSNKPEDYIDAGFLAMHYSEVDLSAVDLSKPGEYEVQINCPGKKMTASLILEDTTPPRIACHDSTLYFAKGTVLEPSDLITYVYDADYRVNVLFEEGADSLKQHNCDNTGTYSVWVQAVDSSGNKSRVCVQFIVDLPPKFDKMCDFYVASGCENDLLKYVYAYDAIDGDLTDKISMYPAEPEINEGETTELKFTVTDSYGLKTSEKVNLYVKSAEEIQKLISDRTITRENAFIIGAINEYDTGLFDNRTIEQTMIDVMPTVVSLRVDENNGSSTTGSGYIIQITDKDVYIVTNHHVVGSFEKCEVCFYTSDRAMGTVVGSSDSYDVAVVRVSLKDLPEKYSNVISTVHLDMTYWNRINDESKVELGLERMTMDGTIEHYTYGLLVSKLQNFEFFSPHLETEMDLKLKLGDSGSAVFDKKGRLICMAFAYSVAPERDWAIPLPEIITAYEDITGNKLYVY